MNSTSTDGKRGKDRPDRAWVLETVARIQRGEALDPLFELVFRDYEPLVRGLLRRRGWSGFDLDDLVQIAMIRVYQGIGEFRFDSSFDTWVLKVMANAEINFIRDRLTEKAKANRTSLESLLVPRDEGGPGMPEPASQAASPEEELLAAERKERLAAALRQLPNRMRQCLLFRYQGYQYGEIARAQGVSVPTVKKQIGEASRRLRPLLGSFVDLFGLILLLILC